MQSPSQQQLGRLLEHYQDGRYADAEKLALSMTQEFPNHQFGWKVLGAVLKKTGRVSEAVFAGKKTVEITPDDAEAHYNLGNTFKELGRLDKAEASYRQAIVLKSDYAEAHNNLGVTLQELDKLEEAEASYRQAIALKSDFAETHNNLGNTLKALGRLEEAIETYNKALYLKPDFAEAYSNMGKALEGIVFRKPNPDFQKVIISILDHKTFVRPQSIATAAISLLKCEPMLVKVFEKHSKNELIHSLQETISNLSELPLLLKLMSVCPLADLGFETVLTDIRSSLLSSISEMAESSDLLHFQSALALQCFTNEYLYDQHDADTKALQTLESKLKETLSNGQQPNPQFVLCLASYKALHKYEWCDLLAVSSEIKEVLIRQVLEPKQESLLKSNFPALEEITDKVSTKVRQQYEGSPYPRWVNLQLSLNPAPISKEVDELKLRFFDNKINEVEAPNILVAGCGTGQHSIETAVRFKNSKVLAIDISLSSLAYAKRKTQDLGIRNIEYMQADILDLAKLDRQFDIVESAGVLHHMDDPMAGWKVLTDCLKKGGLMNIGLYSELGRQHIVKMREEIDQSGIGSSDMAMKAFRNKVIKSDKDHHKRILTSDDFYSLSPLRDLLFHVQEHRFTIPQIKEYLSTLGLKFCGFEPDKIIQEFKLTNAGADDPYDLDKWKTYEETHPYKFAGMYQFWCQKVG